MKKRIVLSLLLSIAVSASGLFALNAVLDSVEITPVLRTDGKADVYYTLDWRASEARCTGSTLRVKLQNRCSIWSQAMQTFRWCALASGNQANGRIKYDVILAKKGFSGQAFYVLNYGIDLAAAGLLGRTADADLGALTYFHWAPVVFDTAMGHRTVTIVLPVQVPKESLAGSDQRMSRISPCIQRIL